MLADTIAANPFSAASIPAATLPASTVPADAPPGTWIAAVSATEAAAKTPLADAQLAKLLEDPTAASLDGSKPLSVSPLPPVFIELQGVIIDLTADESQFIFHAVGGQRFEAGDEVQILADAIQRRSQKAQARVLEVQEDFFIGELISVVAGTKPLEVGDTVVGRREQKE